MKTQHIYVTNDPPGRRAVRRAAERLRRGRLIAFPTETVYGIAALARPDVLEQLDRTKQRPPHKPYTLHIAHPQDLPRYLPSPNLRIRKLMRQAWPGPLTVVFDLNDAQAHHLRSVLPPAAYDVLCPRNRLGVRCPDHPVAHDLLAAVDGPVVVPSANLSGQPPATTGPQAYESLAGRVDVVLDADAWAPCRFAVGSTVVHLKPDGCRILRRGAVPDDTVQRLCTLNILFVCTGNTCRSPMAEAICRKRLSEKIGCDIDALDAHGYKVGSAGIAAATGQPAGPNAVEAVRPWGLDLTRHRSRALDARLLEDADVILVMTEEHRRRILDIGPHLAAKLRRLNDQVDVADPIGGDLQTYRRCAETMLWAVNKHLDEMTG